MPAAQESGAHDDRRDDDALEQKEPTITLGSSGERVLDTVHECVVRLLDTGHSISVDDGVLCVSPPVPPDTLALIAPSWIDVAAVLADHAAAADVLGVDPSEVRAPIRVGLAAAAGASGPVRDERNCALG